MCAETHISDDVMEHEIQFPDYNIIRTNTTNNRTGGAITYIRKDLEYNILFNNADTKQGLWWHGFLIRTKNTVNLTVCNL